MKQDYANSMDTKALDWLRMPMAICVIFIHSMGAKPVNKELMTHDLLAPESLYDLLRVFGCDWFPDFAVPIFFIISGYLFFLKFDQWDWRKYGAKMKRRVGTLLLPYVAWNIYYLLMWNTFTLKQIASGKTGMGALWNLVERNRGIGHLLWDCHTGSSWGYNIWGQELFFEGPVAAHLWYIRNLMVVVALAPLLYYLIKRGGWWILSILMVLTITNLKTGLNGLSISSIFWFMLGGFFSIRKQNIVAELYPYRWAASAVAIILLGAVVTMGVTWQDKYTIAIQLCGLVYTLISAVALIGLAGWCQKNGKAQWIGKLAGATYFVYCAHIAVRYYYMKFFFDMVPKDSYGMQCAFFFVSPFIVAALCIGIWQLYVWAKGKVAKPAWK